MSQYLSGILFVNTRKDLPKTYPLHHRITEWWGYEGVSGDHQGQPSLLKQVHLEQSSIHLTVRSSNSRFLPLPYEEGMGDSVKNPSDVKVDNIYCLPKYLSPSEPPRHYLQ